MKISRLVTLLVLTRLRGRASVVSCFYRQALLRTNILTDNRVQTRHINVQTYWWTFTSKHITSHHNTTHYAKYSIHHNVHNSMMIQCKSSTFMNEPIASGHTWLVQLCPFTVACIVCMNIWASPNWDNDHSLTMGTTCYCPARTIEYALQ